MANRSLHPLLHYLRHLGGRAGEGSLEDAQLLHRFLAGRDESAFTMIVQRYGAMVWALCVRRLGETPEAEDAFQATFLVLVRKAASLRASQLLGPWLYGVANRTALKLRGKRARQATRETTLPEQLAAERPEQLWAELRPILDEEINRLPTKYRLPVLLCYLQGISSEEAARQLGCAKGTIFSRLSRARDLLRRRLVRRGLDVSAGALAAVLVENAALRAAPSLALREITIRISLLLAAGTAGQSLSAPLAALVEGVVRSMFLSKVKFPAIVILALCLAVSGTGFLGLRTDAEHPANPPSTSTNKEKSRAEASTSDSDEPDAVARSKPKAPAPAKVEHFPRMWRDRLNYHVTYAGLDDPRATLTDALDSISKRYNLPFHINETAFHASDPRFFAGRFGITKNKPIPQMDANLSTLLKVILDRLPEKSRALFLIRKDFIEITTEAAARAELGIPANRPLLPLVWSTFENVLITEALMTLSIQSGYNVVTDPRVADKLQMPTGITTVYNVPVDTAVRLLVNMAGLSVVRLDNVLYVTTTENAKHLREEQAKINADAPIGGAGPAPSPAPEKRAK